MGLENISAIGNGNTGAIGFGIGDNGTSEAPEKSKKKLEMGGVLNGSAKVAYMQSPIGHLNSVWGSHTSAVRG
jgi:hypothetical protein